MKSYHHHKYKYFAGEDICRCGESKKHRHQWSIYKQIPLLSNKTWEKCKCGSKRTKFTS